MNPLEILAVALMAAAAIIATARLWLGPTTPDRVVAADTLVVLVTPCMALLAVVLDSAFYLDVALVYAALAFVGVVAIARALEGQVQ